MQWEQQSSPASPLNGGEKQYPVSFNTGMDFPLLVR
jgi:hypothetical protein